MRSSKSLAFLPLLLFLSPLQAAQSESDAIDDLESSSAKPTPGATLQPPNTFKRASDANLYFNLALNRAALAGDTNSLTHPCRTVPPKIITTSSKLPS